MTKKIYYNIYSDFTNLLEKIQIYKINKIFLFNLFNSKIQENILFKYFIIPNNNFTYIFSIDKFNSMLNLNNYIINNFPIIFYYLLPINSIFKLELQIQLNYLINKKKLIVYTKNINSIINIHSIECIFEIFTSKINKYLVSPVTGFITAFCKYNKFEYNLEIPIQSLLNNLNIILISTRIQQNLKHIKILNSLIVGGDILTTGVFSPNILTEYYNNTILEIFSIYTASKNTFIYIYNILLESLLTQYEYQGIFLPSFLFEIIVSRITSYVKIYNIGDTSLTINDIISLSLINLINQSLYNHGMVAALYSPILIGISKLSMSHSGLLSSVSFQYTLKSLSKLVINNETDWLLDLKSKIIISDLLNTGTGWYKHYNIIIK